MYGFYFLKHKDEPPVMLTDEPTVVRCARGLLCETPCLMGRVQDENGCETCQCRPEVQEGLWNIMDQPM